MIKLSLWQEHELDLDISISSLIFYALSETDNYFIN